MSEIEKLLSELRQMKSEDRKSHVLNNANTWSKIGHKDLKAAGFETQEELEAWLEQNDYSNI
jgi:hypothetical protein